MDTEIGTKMGLEVWRVVAPRMTELSPTVPVGGFTSERASFVRGLVERIGLPLDRVSRVKYKFNTSENEYTLGTAHLVTGELTFYKRMEGIPEISQLGVGVHELMHVNSPFVEDNIEAYRSEEAMVEARANAIRVAFQTADSGKYLNGYHHLLHDQLKAGKISGQTFAEETNAIMTELRFTNPRHLEEVLRVQNPSEADEILNQLDKTLVNLMQLNNKTELDNHIEALKSHYKQPQAK